ncbi:MAG: glutaredoxin family protein [Promethearchaeota archaeon]
MSAEEVIKKLVTEVDGKEGIEDNIIVFTLSTCMWCKKCKSFLNENNMKYRYIDVDKIDPSDKAKIIEYLRSKYQSRVSYPFLVCEKGHVVGYNPEKYKELLKR